jgi:Fe2+ or Zn2+ uptake regulation protein
LDFIYTLPLLQLLAVHTSLLDRLRLHGYRLTAQRRAVAQALDGINVHLSADEVHARAADILPEVSRATVYSTLHELTEMGEILELGIEGRSKRYDPTTSPHNHLVCDSCGVIHDVQHGLAPPELPVSEAHGMAVRRAEVVYHATCESCLAT